MIYRPYCLVTGTESELIFSMVKPELKHSFMTCVI